MSGKFTIVHWGDLWGSMPSCAVVGGSMERDVKHSGFGIEARVDPGSKWRGSVETACGHVIDAELVRQTSYGRTWPRCAGCRAALGLQTPTDKAEARGAADRAAGVPQRGCPYPDHRTDAGKVTFSRALRNAWLRGWRRGVPPDDASRAPDPGR